MKESLKRYLRIISNIATIIAMIFLIRYLGLKGMIGILLGMTIMAYLLLSKSTYFLGLIKFFEGDDYIEEIKRT